MSFFTIKNVITYHLRLGSLGKTNSGGDLQVGGLLGSALRWKQDCVEGEGYVKPRGSCSGALS